MVDVAQRLSTLSTRPPTPPKERNEPILETSSPNGYLTRVTQHILLDTPNESPSSSAEYFGGSSEKGTKKVEFSPWPSVHKAIILGGRGSGSEGNIRRLPPSRDCKSSKSILKETLRSSPLAELPALTSTNIPEMLRSAIMHLKSASRSSRLDAYSALLGCMSAYDDVPDPEALLNSLPEFIDIIRRDMCATIDSNGTLDTQMTSQSLKLLIVFLCTSTLATALRDDFRVFILDKSIGSIENTALPKVLVTHYMQILVKQDFSTKHMTSDRANRLLSALVQLTNHQKGNSIVGLRLKIYQRLLSQAKPPLVAHAEHWIDHLISGMLSATKDIRALAITFGIDAGISLGSTRSVSQACFDLFARKSPEGQTVVDYFAARLNTMISSQEDSVHVPPIWSVVILLLRNRRHKLERWLHLKPWLMVLQKCFNSSEAQMKLVAMTAWNRLVYVVELDASTAPQMIRMLRQPIMTQLSRKGNDKYSKRSKQIAQSSYCNLLYYALRPSANYAQLDLYWDQYIDHITSECFTGMKRDTDRFCEILAALLCCDQPRSWDENRANVVGFIKPDEIPALDPKWVRSRAGKVLGVFGRLAASASWSPSEQDKLPLVRAWRGFTKSLAEASRQEVKVSSETMSAIAYMLNMMKSLLDKSRSPDSLPPTVESQIAIDKVQILILHATHDIGPLPFNEQRILYGLHNQFEAAETPSSRSNRHPGTMLSPTTHLLRFLVNSVQDDVATERYTSILQSLLKVALSSASSRRSQLSTLRELTTLLYPADSRISRPRIMLWCLIAEAAQVAISRPKPSEKSDSPEYSGHEFRDTAKILEIGIHNCSIEMISTWQEFLSLTCDVLEKEIGDGGICLIITEPLSDAIQNTINPIYREPLLAFSISVIRRTIWPRNPQLLDRARKLLWGISPASHRPGSFDPFDKLYAMIDQCLFKAYDEFTSICMSDIASFFCATENLLASLPASAKYILLKRIQQGFTRWIEDRSGVVAGFKVGSDLEQVYSTTQSLWIGFRKTIESLPYTKVTLAHFEAFMTSSLTSRHKRILNNAIALWNGTFGTAETLEYSINLRTALSRLNKINELQLPTFPYEDDTEVMSSSFDFIESQDIQEDGGQQGFLIPSKVSTTESKPGGLNTPARSRGPPRCHPTSLESKSLRRTIASRVAKTPPKVRLRHDDSQIQFAAIDSSPLASEDIDSQLLTDHQKETKERQMQEAAMFPKLGSSPPSSVRRFSTELPRLVLDRGSKSPGLVEPDGQVSPALPVIEENLEAFLGSSPTPRSSKKFSSNPSSDMGPPSSSPGVPSLADYFPQQAEPDSSAALAEDDILPDMNAHLEAEVSHQSHRLEEHPSPEVVEDCNVVTNDHLRIAQAALDGEEYKFREKVVGSGKDIDSRVFSDFDIFVDAPTEPLQAQGRTHGDEDLKGQADHMSPGRLAPQDMLRGQEAGSVDDPPITKVVTAPADLGTDSEASTSRIMDSSLSQSSQYTQDEEQIAAQLAVDIERSASQAERRRIGELASTSTRKRKRGSSASDTLAKKPRRSSRIQNYQVVIEKNRPDINKDEYATLDTRSMSRSPPPPLLSKEQERYTPPSDLGHTTPNPGEIDPGARDVPRAAAAEKPPSQLRTPETRNSKTSVVQKPLSRGRRVESTVQDVEQDNPAAPAIDPLEEDETASWQPHNIPTPSPRKSAYRRLMDRFKNLLGEVRQVTLRAEEERAMTGVLFESILEVHEAGKRHPRS